MLPRPDPDATIKPGFDIKPMAHSVLLGVAYRRNELGAFPMAFPPLLALPHAPGSHQMPSETDRIDVPVPAPRALAFHTGSARVRLRAAVAAAGDTIADARLPKRDSCASTLRSRRVERAPAPIAC